MGSLFKAKRSLYIHPDVCPVVSINKGFTFSWAFAINAKRSALSQPFPFILVIFLLGFLGAVLR